MSAVAWHGAAGPRPRSRRRRETWRAPAALVLLLVAVSTLYPLAFVASISAMTTEQYQRSPLGVPAPLTLDAYRRVWSDADFARYVANSLALVSVSVVAVLALACMAGFAFAHMGFPFKRSLHQGVLALMILPPSLFVVPIFKVVLDLDLLNSYAGMVLVYVSLQLPFGIFMMASFFQGVPTELLDAANVDGAGLVRTFRSIALPLARPAVFTLTTLTFLALWNELLFSLVVLQDPDKRTLTVGLSLLKNEFLAQTNTLVAAGMAVSALPPLLLFALFNRQITTGLQTGALK